ncbi:unnamed protein product [Spirodela intermedia]|uniref:TORTIFOLIA1/SINE1-2 N-terminal domain-containing protein n=1 Tax=Spirodela intermedia TaxID=51605 RepID=A0A7I8JWV2_SPIIN|nr:unnamed protein product [Spirodela intermedia]
MSRTLCPPHARGRNLSPALLQELEKLEKDADSRKSALKALKSYVKDLDTKAIPLFLAQVSETKEQPGASFGEHTISLYEVLARVHGPNIVPQIESIMASIVKTLHSSAGSFPLHQACSKVAPAIARYAIDPSSTAGEAKARIIRSLCKPLSDVLMGPAECVASGAALCLKVLVESDNWRFASDEMVNEVCLKVSGAMEEAATQTNAHMGLVMALSKHSIFVLEAYARSLLRSGLRILTTGTAEVNSQRRFSAIQMINFLMKCVDSRSIASELDSVVEVMEQCNNDDRLLFIRGAAFEALQTAKLVAAQESSRYEKGWTLPPAMEVSETPLSGGGSGYASPESRTIDSFLASEGFPWSPLSSVGQSSCDLGHPRRSSRKLWINNNGGVDVSLKDGLFSESMSAIDSPRQRPREGTGEQSVGFCGFSQANNTSVDVKRQDVMAPQRPRSPMSINSMKLYATPRKLIRSLQDPGEEDLECPQKQPGSAPNSLSSDEIEWNPTEAQAGGGGHSNDTNSPQSGEYDNADDEDMLERSESVSSCGETPEGTTAGNASEEAICEENNGVQSVRTRGRAFCRLTVTLVFTLLWIMAALVLLVAQINQDEGRLGVVPT